MTYRTSKFQRLEAGKLNKRLTFQSGVAAAGEGTTTYTDQFTVWGAIMPLVGNRRYQAQQLNADIAGTVQVRYRSDIVSSMRIKFGTRILEIISIRNPSEANESLEIDYKEVLD